jgi:hypothetical protein
VELLLCDGSAILFKLEYKDEGTREGPKCRIKMKYVSEVNGTAQCIGDVEGLCRISSVVMHYVSRLELYNIKERIFLECSFFHDRTHIS